MMRISISKKERTKKDAASYQETIFYHATTVMILEDGAACKSGLMAIATAMTLSHSKQCDLLTCRVCKKDICPNIFNILEIKTMQGCLVNFYTFIILAHTVSHKEVSDKMVLANQGGIKGNLLYFNYK